MVAIKHCLLAYVVFLPISFSAKAQQCGNCKEVPKVIGFGFDIKVKEPNKEEGTDNLWPDWKNLFMIAPVVATKIENAEGGCIKMTVPPSVDTGDVELISVGGETFVNLPSNPLISANLSKYGNYLMTGSITSSGTACQLNIEIQTACSRKTVVSAQTNFSLTSIVGNVSNIAQQVASQLSPLAEKIKNFELSARQQSKNLSLYPVSWGEPIKIIPQKKALRSGESTSFTIEVKDCDGVPLAGREVLFTETMFEGFKVPGTVGGTVSPAKVITDDKGMAKATFTLKSGSHEAFISAHSWGKDVKGCESILFGDAPINIKYTYSGYVIYTYEGSSGLTSDKSDQTMSYVFAGKETSSISYRASFYGDGGGRDFSLNSIDDESSGTDIPDLFEFGSYDYKKSDYWKNTVICNCASRGEVSEQKIKANSSGELKHSSIAFSSDGDSSGRLSLNLVFTTSNSSSIQATNVPSQSSNTIEEFSWSADFDTLLDKNLKIKKDKVGNKTRYTIEGEQTVKVNQLSQTGKVKMVVIEE